MTATSATIAGRALYAELMIDMGRIERSGGDATLNETTGAMTLATPIDVYDGPMRVRTPTAQDQMVLFGGTDVTRLRFVISLPWDAPMVLIDDIVKVTASSDPYVHLRSFRITGVPSRTFLTRRDLAAEVIE